MPGLKYIKRLKEGKRALNEMRQVTKQQLRGRAKERERMRERTRGCG